MKRSADEEAYEQVFLMQAEQDTRNAMLGIGHQPLGDVLHVDREDLHHFKLATKPAYKSNRVPKHISEWKARHPANTIYMKTPSTNGMVWVRPIFADVESNHYWDDV